MPDADGDAGMESALLVLVPEADPVVGEHRALLDLSALDGVPAHLTVLYPFLPPQRIGPEELADLTRLFAGFRAFDFTLDRVGWFGDAVAWLGPANDTSFRELTALASAAYPACPPYGGVHDDVVPHLTIGHLGGTRALRAAADSVRPRLPIPARASAVTLMTGLAPGSRGADSPAQWTARAVFPLASSKIGEN